MDTAPTAAQEVANEMHNAAPGLENIYIDGGDSDETGEVIVIANAGDDPKLACFKALGFLASVPDEDDEGDDLWQFTTLDECNWNDCFNRGFTLEEEDEDDVDEDVSALLAMHKILAERLSGHFTFNFTENVVVAPTIYGGYSMDGSIVGVLSARTWT